MTRNVRMLAVALVVVVAANTALALAVPRVLDAAIPSMPHGYREEKSPTVDAGANFVSVAQAAGIDFHRYMWDSGDMPYPAVLGGGVAAADVDHDGFTDLYFPPGGPGFQAKLYRNLGQWKFLDITREAGLEADGFGTSAVFGDLDNDGDADLFALVDGNGKLYRNDGTGHFADITAGSSVGLDGACGERPCQPAGAAWGDYDHDGKLDLYVINNLDWRKPDLHTSGQDYSSLIYFAPRQFSMLFHNEGEGVFRDVTDEFGVENTGKGLAVTMADLDGNGWDDILTANDISENAAYLNRGGTGFESAGRRLNVNEVKTSMGIMAGDADEDGHPDLVVSNFRGQKLSLLMQQPDGTFSYATDSNGLGASWRGTGWGVQFFDYDLDGWLDIAHAVGRAVPLAPHLYDLHNVVFQELVEDSQDELFKNLGNGQYGEATASAGDFGGMTNTRAILAVDLDNDGDEDVVRVNIQGEPAEVLRNDLANDHHWLQLDFTGKESNRDGFGAQVRVELSDGRVLHRELVSAAGYETGMSGVLTVGLDWHDGARVVVTWPSGLRQDFGTLRGDARYTLTEGGAAAS